MIAIQVAEIYHAVKQADLRARGMAAPPDWDDLPDVDKYHLRDQILERLQHEVVAPDESAPVVPPHSGELIFHAVVHALAPYTSY